MAYLKDPICFSQFLPISFMIAKNIILFLLIINSHFVTSMHNKTMLAVAILNHEQFQHIEELRQTLAINQCQKAKTPYYKVESPCNCIPNGNYTNMHMGKAIESSINISSLKQRKIATQYTLKQIELHQAHNLQSLSPNTVANYYNYYGLHQHNLEFLMQENGELRHAKDLLSHVQESDAATTIASLVRKKIALNKVAKMRAEKIALEESQRDQKNQKQEPVTMAQEERRTKKVIAQEKEQAQLRAQQDLATKKLDLVRASKETQRQKDCEKKSRLAAEKQAEEQLKKQKQKESSLQQKALAQAKKDQAIAQQKIQQEKDAHDLALLTNIAQWESQAIHNKMPSDQEHSQVDDHAQLTNQSNLSAASIDNDDPMDYLETRNNICRQIKEVMTPTDQNNKALQVHEELMIAQRLKFQEKTMATINELNRNSIEFNNFTAWQEQQQVLKLKREDEKEEQRKKNIKILLKTKGSDRPSKKTELTQKLEDNFTYISPVEKTIVQLFKTYDKILSSKSTLSAFEQIEAIFIESDERLRTQNESLKWYLANNPALYQSIKDKYLLLQRNINHEEREIVVKKFEKMARSHTIKDLSPEEFEKLGVDYQKISAKLSQVEILRKLESLHINRGILDISKLLYPNQPAIDINSLGTLSPSILQLAETEIKSRIVAHQHIHNFHQITPIVESLLRQIDLEPSSITINSMINSAAEITLIEQGKTSASNFFPEIKRSVFVTLQRENELILKPHTINQMADITKIHCCIIKAFLDAQKEGR